MRVNAVRQSIVRFRNGKGGCFLDRNEVYKICKEVDNCIADKLTEAIVDGTSYEMLEARYGILPISRRSFYRRRTVAKQLIRQKEDREIRKRED